MDELVAPLRGMTKRWAVDEKEMAELTRLREFLHSRMMHPDFEYQITKGPRKSWDGKPDLAAEGWERQSWERFDYHEEIVWRKRHAS